MPTAWNQNKKRKPIEAMPSGILHEGNAVWSNGLVNPLPARAGHYQPGCFNVLCHQVKYAGSLNGRKAT
jgi:hypothetical protein